MAETTILNIGNPDTGVRYQLDGERARDVFVDEYRGMGFVLYDRDGGKPDRKATRELVRAVNEARAPKEKAEAPAEPAGKGKKD